MPAGACPERSRRAGMTEKSLRAMSFPRKRESSDGIEDGPVANAVIPAKAGIQFLVNPLAICSKRRPFFPCPSPSASFFLTFLQE